MLTYCPIHVLIYIDAITDNEYCRIALGQMQWRGWSTYSDIMAIWSWLDTEQSMRNFTTETIKVCMYSCVHVCDFLMCVSYSCVCVCVWAILSMCSVCAHMRLSENRVM